MATKGGGWSSSLKHTVASISGLDAGTAAVTGTGNNNSARTSRWTKAFFVISIPLAVGLAFANSRLDARMQEQRRIADLQKEEENRRILQKVMESDSVYGELLQRANRSEQFKFSRPEESSTQPVSQQQQQQQQQQQPKQQEQQKQQQP